MTSKPLQPFTKLKTDNIKNCLIILDIDGTITVNNGQDVNIEAIKIINELKKDNKIYLCSNNPNAERNKFVANFCKINYLDTEINKPSKRILDLIDHSSFKKKLVIGDQFLTDGLFAKSIKSDFIKVKRIISNNDKISIKLLYWIDDTLYKMTQIWNKS